MTKPPVAMLTSLLIAAGTAIAWQQPETDFRLTAEVRLVVLDISVRNSKGAPVAGLTKEAFRVWDSGAPKPVASFAGEDAPVSMGLVVDTSGSMKPKQRELVLAAETFLRESNASDEVFLTTFNDIVRTEPPMAKSALRDRIEAAPLRGRTALFDALGSALTQLKKGSRERKAVVLISDGGDNASTTRRDDILRMAHLSQATIHVIGITDPEGHEADPRFLRELAHLTGGECHVNIAPSQLPEVCMRIAREIRARYTLCFSASEPHQTEIRPIKVEVKAPDYGRLRVLTRPSYVATETVRP